MKVQVEKQAKSEIKLTIEIEENEMAEYEKEAVNTLQNEVKVDGFRAGNIPLDVMRKKMGEQAFMSHVVDIALQKTYEKAMKQEKIAPVAYPKISIVSDKPFKFEAVVAVIPEVTFKKGLEKISVSPKKIEIKEEEIKDVLDNLKNRSKKWKDVEREAKKGDRVEVDFEGFDMGGAPLDGTASKNHPVVLGENTLIPGFEEEVIGMKKDEEKDFEITFPKDYHSKPFQSKKVKFHVKLNRIEESEEQELNDAFVETLTGGKHKTLSALSEEIKGELTHQKEHEEQTRLENEFLDKLTEVIEADVPEALLERERQFLKGRIEKDLEKQGISWDDYKKMMSEKKKDLDKEVDTQANKQVLIRLGLEKLYDQEKVEISEKEVEAEVGHTLSHYPKEYAAALQEQYKKGGEAWEQIKNSLRLKKVVEKYTN